MCTAPDLGNRERKLAFGAGERIREKSPDAVDAAGLERETAKV